MKRALYGERAKPDYMDLFRRRCSSEAVFIDAWYPGIGESKVPEEELLLGEIEAVTYQVGCYTARSALRIYTIRDSYWYLDEVGELADKEDVRLVRKDLLLGEGDRKETEAKDSIFASWEIYTTIQNIYHHGEIICDSLMRYLPDTTPLWINHMHISVVRLIP